MDTLKLHHVLDFLKGIEYDNLEEFFNERKDLAGDHCLTKLRGYSSNYGWITMQAICDWLCSLDKKHIDAIEEYIVKNHKF